MNKVAIFVLLIAVFYGCKSNDRGELVDIKAKKKWFSEKPYGMTLIPGGSFTMGKQDEDVIGSLNTPTRTVTVRPYYMDETEITNNEYKEFVTWVRDSVTRTKLAQKAYEIQPEVDPTGSAKTGIQEYAYADSDTTGQSAYQKYMTENYYELDENYIRPLDWSVDLSWDKAEYPDVDYVEVIDTLFVSKEDAAGGIRTFNKKFLRYRYIQLDASSAARNKEARKNYVKDTSYLVYPDTTVWIKDFNYSYNDPMHQDYFHHQAYGDYPVVGVTWDQANAFCNWRTKKKNDYLRGKRNPTTVPVFRLPTEAEWEYAARGGLMFSKYPWGGPSAVSDRGCFLANFKPVRGDYAVDGALYTVEAKSYNANDYGLYNMAGNVSEWTSSAYNLSSYYMGSTMNPNVEDRNNKKKIVRGGSWKDVAYYLEVGTRDFEYADTARSFIGFRTVQDYIGYINK